MSITTKKLSDVQLDDRAINIQLEEATVFFNSPDRSPTRKSKEAGNPYADKNGLIEFIGGVAQSSDEVIATKLKELNSQLIMITSMVTAYVNQHASKHGSQFKTDAQLWADTFSMIPLMRSSKPSGKVYSRKIRGTEVAPDFLNLLLDFVPVEGPALSKFRSFLMRQGDVLRTGIENNKDFYRTITLGISTEVLKTGDKIEYVPKVKQYCIDFTKENSKWSASCASSEQVVIDVNYTYNENVFDYKVLKDPAVKGHFDALICGTSNAGIENASTFFNEEFNIR